MVRKPALLLVLILLLPTPAAQAAEPGTHKSPAGVLAQVWEFLTRVWANNGCRIDPDGRCITGQNNATAQEDNGDNGCGLDPNGGCGR